jgi:hypothetical protein
MRSTRIAACAGALAALLLAAATAQALAEDQPGKPE